MIVCLEGVNGAGKTTLANSLILLWTSGRAQAIDPVQHTRYGTAIRTALMSAEKLSADAESLAFASSRMATASALKPQPLDLIVLERWAGAVVAYGTVAGTSPFLLRSLEAALAGALPVDVTVLVDLPGAAAHERVTSLEDTNRFETQGPRYLERVRRQYLAWASLRQVPVINGLRDQAAIVDQVADLINTRVAESDGGTSAKESA
ncbi:hypothetical protein LO762_29850 [Actinocorallia sp. API 0066]|uniref:dTMP kinase n=1 Tax=Actinocorallia sp. API 0066 TaxID=2896846 RepID=UPI001E296000|nr:hypothetical protein [Actinocorallia sp. API 0066]MCD0453353.1 hypothetical protein [Actinocorallia sp. API 0066]